MGSVSSDEFDFKRLEQLLGLESWMVLGVSYMLHPNEAATVDSSLTCEAWARLWAIERTQQGEAIQLDQVVQRGSVLEVTEFTVDGVDTRQTDIATIVSVMLHSSRRTSIVMWRSIVYSRGLTRADFDVIDTRRLVWDRDHYAEATGRL